MASSTEAAALTAAAQRAQAVNAALVAALVRESWSATVRPNASLFDSASRMLELLLPVLLMQRRNSALISRQYYQAFRVLETGDRNLIELGAIGETGVEDAMRTSLRVTGPIAYQKRLEKISGMDLDPAVERALLDDAWRKTIDGVEAALTKHVLNGGREQTIANVQQDQRALGHVRVTAADCCYFCAALASRGPVYQDDSFDDSDPRFTGPGDSKVHDNCQCGLEPVFNRATEWPGRAREFETLWRNATAAPGNKMLLFRQAYEGRAA